MMVATSTINNPRFTQWTVILCNFEQIWFVATDFDTFSLTSVSKHVRSARAMACKMCLTYTDTMVPTSTTQKSRFTQMVILSNFEQIWFDMPDFKPFLSIYTSKYGHYAQAMACQMCLT